MPELDGCSLVVCGGTSGIGLATAERFLAAGARGVVIIGRDADRAAAAVGTLRASGPRGQVHAVCADGNDPAQAAAAVAEAEETLDGIDVLVTATAGSFSPELLHEIDAADIPRILAEQALAPLLMTRLALPGMITRRGGVIVNVASDAAKTATPGESVIGAAMAAIVNFTRAVALENKRHGIRANALTPSLVAGTPTTERVTRDGFSAKLFSKVTTLARLGLPDAADQAELILYLASPAAARLTGQAVSLNGGVSAA